MPEALRTGKVDMTPTRTGILQSAATLSHIIARDPFVSDFQLGLFAPQLIGRHSRINVVGQRPQAARLNVDRDLRRVEMGAIAERIGLSLLPYTYDLLQSESAIVTRYQQEGWFDKLRGDKVYFRGDRERIHYGDEARFAVTFLRLRQDAKQALYDQLRRTGEHDVFINEVGRLTRNVNEQVRRTKEEEEDALLENQGRNTEPYYKHDGDTRSGKERVLAFLSSPTFNPDLDTILGTNINGQAEFYASALADLQYAFNEAGCPTEYRLDTALRHIPILSSLAGLKDERSGDIFFAENIPGNM